MQNSFSLFGLAHASSFREDVIQQQQSSHLSLHILKDRCKVITNKSSTYINIRFSRLVNVTIWLLKWLLIEWFRSV